jgi:dTDP-4-dehydrorhamnose reductase
MKVLITGSGQVATALLRLRPMATDVLQLPHTELDVGDRDAVLGRIAAEKPTVIINAAAYTAVDKAESEAALAMRVNGAAPGYLAEAAKDNGARFLHISTDFVFDGAQSRPYAPDAAVRPLGVYGASKLTGEQRVMEVLEGKALVLRTAWIYAANGHNFVRTMLRLMVERNRVRVVADQVGTPTWAGSVAEALWAAARAPEFAGVHHWTDAGVASWYDFAVAIAEEGHATGLLKQAAEVESITTADYPTPARRPAYSVLDRNSTERALGLKPAHWRVNLRKMLKELQSA